MLKSQFISMLKLKIKVFIHVYLHLKHSNSSNNIIFQLLKITKKAFMENIQAFQNLEKLYSNYLEKSPHHQFLKTNKVVSFTLFYKNQKSSVNLSLTDIYKQLSQYQKNGKLNKLGGMFHH